MPGTWMRRYAETLIQWRWAVLAVAAMMTVFLVSRVTSLKLDNDPDLWAPQNEEFIKTTHELEQTFGGRNFTVIGIVAQHGTIDDPRILEKIKRIQTGIEELPEAIRNNVISVAAKRVKDIRGEEDGMVVHQFLDPIPRTPEQLAAFETALARNPVYINALVSPDRKAAAVFADFRMSGENTAYAPLYEKIKAIADKERDATVSIHLGGQPIQAANFEFAMQKMPIYFGTAFLIIMTIQLFVFRSIQGMLLPMVTAILSVLWGLGVMALLGIHMDALNTTTPILIMAVAAGHSVQILKRYYEELEKVSLEGTAANRREANRLAVIRSVAKVGPVMLTAGSIAAIAFFSLMFTDMKMIRHFGLFAGVGILSALILELSFIPALRAVMPAKVRLHDNRWIDAGLSLISHGISRPDVSRAVLLTAALVVVVSVGGALRLRADNSVKQYNPAGSAVRQDDAVLNHAFGGTEAIMFLVDAGQSGGIKDPKVLQAMDKLQAFLDSQPNVGKTQSLADLIKRMNQATHHDDAAFNRIPDDRNLIAQYLLLYSLSGDPQDFDSLVDNDYRKAVVVTYLKTDSTAYAMSLYERSQQVIAKEFPAGVNVRIGGGLPQTVAINNALTQAKVKNIVQMAFVVFLLSSVVLGSVMGGILVVIPLCVVIVANLGIMGWFGIPLDMGTATTTAMVVGIGADYEIYMLSRLKEEFARCRNLGMALEASLLSSGKAVLFVALSVAGGYAALLMADFKFYPRLGMTMMTTMFISASLSLLFLRAMIVILQPKFIVDPPSHLPRLALQTIKQERSSV